MLRRKWFRGSANLRCADRAELKEMSLWADDGNVKAGIQRGALVQ